MLKAISQNLMHANLSVTDGIYGILSDMDVKKHILGLGRVTAKTNDDVYEILERLLAQRNKKFAR